MTTKPANNMPAGTEAKAWQFAAMTLRDGFKGAYLSVQDGDVAHLSLFDHDGTQHFYKLIGGEFYEVGEVDGE